MNTLSFIEVLRAFVATHYSQKRAAHTLAISPQYLNDILRGHREPSETVAAKMGFRRVIEFLPIKPNHQPQNRPQ